MDAMRIAIDGLVFDDSDYDADGDVLYLSRGPSRTAADGEETPEGHVVRYNADGDVIGVTIISAKSLLERDGYLKITMPHEVRLRPGELTPALAAA